MLSKSEIEEGYYFTEEPTFCHDCDLSRMNVCNIVDCDGCGVWKKKLKEEEMDTIITFKDGTEVELSEESYKRLRDGVNPYIEFKKGDIEAVDGKCLATVTMCSGIERLNGHSLCLSDDYIWELVPYDNDSSTVVLTVKRR